MRKPTRLRAVLAPSVAGVALVAAGCAGQHAASATPAGASGSGSGSASAIAGAARIDTLKTVARRLYLQETKGDVGHVAVKRIAKDRRLLAALESGDAAALRAQALRQLFNPGKHVVRLRVVRGSRVLVDVGGAFVVSPAQKPLLSPTGARLGTLQASMQDLIGYVKLVHRFTGIGVVVRGNSGHVEALPASLAHKTLPLSGTASIGGRSKLVRSFTERGFAGEPLRVWVVG
jgi:hypothetical protein